jgi:hypothetical protein
MAEEAMTARIRLPEEKKLTCPVLRSVAEMNKGIFKASNESVGKKDLKKL